MTLAVGALLQDNRYQIQSVLTSTDVETVYQAVHTYLNRTVALKQLQRSVDWSVAVPPTSRAIMARLLRLSQCQHPCLGEVLDCFEEDGQVYLVLPTYGDLTMAKWIQSQGPVKPFEMLAYLRSLVDIFDKFHENGLIYGQLSPDSLHYRTETNELIITDFSWRMFIADLLGDRHHLNYSKPLDLQRLAYIAYSLLTGDCSALCSSKETVDSLPNEHTNGTQDDSLHGKIGVPKLDTIRSIANVSVETAISNALDPQTAQSLTPTDWFIDLQQALCSSPEDKSLDEKSSEFPLSIGLSTNLPKSSPTLTITPYPGEKVLTHTVDGNVLSKSEDDIPLTSALSLSEEDETGDASLLSEAPTDGDAYGETLAHQRQDGIRWLRLKRGLPLLLGATSIVAAVSGGLLGYVFRIQDVEKLEQSPLFGNEVFGRDQEFPPSEHWPGLNPDTESNPSVLFERSRTQNANNPTPESKNDVLFSGNGADVEQSSTSAVPASGSTVTRSNPDVIRSAPVKTKTEAVISNDSPAPEASSELSNESNPALEPSSTPEKAPKPQDSQQPVVPAPSPDAPSESSVNPPPPQPQPARINEMPPSSGQAAPPSPPNSEPAPNVSTPGRTPAKQPKLLITPVPSPQNQSVDVDSTDVS